MSESLRDQLTAAFEQSIIPAEEQTTLEDTVVEASQDIEEVSQGTQLDDEQSVEHEINAPDHWAPEDKEVFGSLDTRGREFLLRRHKEMEASHTKKQQALADERKQVEAVIKAVEPYEGYLKRSGLSREEAVNKLLATAQRLDESNPQDKIAILHSLARDYGVQLGNHEEAEPLNHEAQLLLDKINRIEADNYRLQEAHRLREEASKWNEEKSLQNVIDEFSNQKDEKGNLKYPHFDTLRQDMGLLLNAGKAKSLEDAYESAIYLNSDLRKEYNSRQYNKDKQEADIRQKTAASKRAGFNVKSGSVAQLSDPKEALSLRDEIRRNVEAGYRI